jgi:F420-non-reducing hydrogenase small subunit
MPERNDLGGGKMKGKISTEWLSGCSGCHVAIVDLHEKLLNLVEIGEFVRLPVLMDEKGYPPAEVGIVEGAVRSEHDRQALLKFRKSVSTLIAFGSCAVYGGPSGIGWLYDHDTILDRVYGKGPTNTPGQRPDSGAVKLEKGVIPVDEVVDVDIYLPGCPPHPYFIASVISGALGASAPPVTGKTVCADCERKMLKRDGVPLIKGAVTAGDDSLCFLSQGVICLGSVTLNRCLAPCPASGIACTGCNGPSMDIITEPHLDIRNLIARRMSLLSGTSAGEITEYMEEEAKTFYSYVLASPAIYKKPSMEIREWAGDTAEKPATGGQEG